MCPVCPSPQVIPSWIMYVKVYELALIDLIKKWKKVSSIVIEGVDRFNPLLRI
jgi:hypothetical protein